MANIHLNQIKNNLFFYQREKKDNYEQNERIYTTKTHDVLFINELKINEIIKKSKLCYNYYDLMVDYKMLTMAECGENFLTSIENGDVSDKYYIVSYSKRELIDFSSYLYSITYPRHFLSTLLETYKKLLENLLSLSNVGIFFYNISAIDIYYTCDGIPVLKNMNKCIVVKNLDTKYFSHLLEAETNFVSKPIEIHVLFLLLKNDIDTLTIDLVNNIIQKFTSNVKIFSYFSLDYRENYCKDAFDFLNDFIGKPKKYIVECILSYAKTWDCYSLSFLFTYIVANIFKVFSLKETFMSKFLSLLMKCLHANPSKRETSETLLYKFNELLYKKLDWHFVTEMKKENLERLHSILQNE